MNKNIKGKMITTYLGNAKNIPSGYLKVLVMRKPFSSTIKDFIIERDLGPLETIHDNYKDNKDWETFRDEFNEQLEADTDTKKSLDKVLSLVEKGQNIALACCEKEYLRCHRYLLGQHYKNKGVEVFELQGEDLISL